MAIKLRIRILITKYQTPTSRRDLLVGLFASLATLCCTGAAANQTKPRGPIDLGNGLQIRDYRLFPTQDVMRFIVEIHNTTDAAVDTPTVGAVLPHLDDYNFGWAIPVSPVLHPHMSDCLIGVAPEAVKTDEDCRTPDWMLCSGIESYMAVSIQDWQYELSHSIEILSDTHMRTTVEVTNHNSETPGQLIL